MGGQRARRVISVGGGKGGVGKSIVAANLGVAMAQAGARVIIVDGDLGSANQHTLFGIDKPGPTLQGLLDRSIASLDEAIVPTAVPNLQLVPGSCGVVGSANIPFQQKLKLIRHIRALDADAVVIDVGAGVSFNVLDLFDAADLRLVVMTTQLTSLQSCYAFLKGAVFRELRKLADTAGRAGLVEESPEAHAATRRVPDLVARVREKDAAFGSRLLAGLATFGARVVGNQVFDPSERGVLEAISRMTSDFLGVDTPVIGMLRASRKIHDSVQSRRPYLLEAAAEESAVALRQIARSLLQTDVGALRLARQATEERECHADESRQEPLPAPLESYSRAHERFPIRCKATLIFAAGTLSVEVLDVSEGGAKLAVPRPPPAGSRAVLILGALPDRPSVPCVVRHTSGETWGVEFLADARLTRRLVKDLVARFASPDPAPEEPRP